MSLFDFVKCALEGWEKSSNIRQQLQKQLILTSDFQIRVRQHTVRLVVMMASRNDTDLSHAVCHWNIKRCASCLRRQLTLGWPIVKFLFLTTSAIYFIFILRNYNVYHQTNLHGTQLMTAVNRATCCLSPNQQEDICGRTNCTLPCSEPEPSILESDPAICHSIRDRDNAFFIETSGSGGLSFRQACAVESLALHNPNLTVYVLFVNVIINSSVVTLKKLREEYRNIRLISINSDDYMAGTPLEHWYHCTNWNNGSFYVNNLSNGLRLLTLTKYGGYYFDLDIIFVRPVTYYRNFVAAQDHTDVNNDAIHADLENPVLKLAIKDFVDNFRPDIWGHNGPTLISRVLKKWCNVDNLASMDYVSCRGFNVLPTSSFHPVHYGKMKELFIPKMANETDAKVASWLSEKVIGVHIWNKLSKGEPIYKNSTQDYIRLARDHCPLIFSISPDIF